MTPGCGRSHNDADLTNTIAMPIAPNMTATVGNTPLIRLNRLFGATEVWIKSERSNPGGSIKDRIALALLIHAKEKRDGSDFL